MQSTLQNLINRASQQFLRLNQTQKRQSTTPYGLTGGHYQAASYESFRHHIKDVNTPLVCNKKGTTFIFNHQKKVCAVIKSPYFDLRGQCQPVRYFLTTDVQLSTFSVLRCIELPLMLCRTNIKHAATLITQSVKQLFTWKSKLHTKLHTGSVNKIKTSPVWTTMRLTA